ncbi:MAG: hypothetical protein JWO20_2793 [Candidatus Angelobacter sp.]|nr:hypothetical protein [Candidatus Angelobacter sp.]
MRWIAVPISFYCVGFGGLFLFQAMTLYWKPSRKLVPTMGRRVLLGFGGIALLGLGIHLFKHGL